MKECLFVELAHHTFTTSHLKKLCFGKIKFPHLTSGAVRNQNMNIKGGGGGRNVLFQKLHIRGAKSVGKRRYLCLK